MSETTASGRLEDAVREIKPVLDQVTRLVATCPLPKQERAALTVLVLGHFAGAAMAELDIPPTPRGAAQLGQVLADALLRGMN
jgi:hypothetical protein